MAEYCPKCNYKLKLTDWRPECPKCGVNVMYYGIEDRLREEADRAEYQHAKSQPKYDRLKFSLIGHPLSIVRIVLGLLPIVATLLPMGTVNYVLPYLERNASVNLVSIITFIIDNGFDVDLILKALGSDLVGTGMIFWAVSLVSLVLMVVLTLVGFFLLTLSAAPKGIVRNITIPVIGIVLATVSFVSYNLMINNLTEALPGIFTGTVNPAAYIVAVLLFAVIIAVNVIYKKKNIQVKYKDVSEFLLPYNERPSTLAKLAEKEANA
ncbi:MAG: hypothetical protein E7535_05720 [Ruminococcaceae bacterium]|nr:hypothetical protein [Oscillospiraceae bacterium]